MPYIQRGRRQELARTAAPESPGELNYLICMMVDEYLMRRGVTYDRINDVVGALECAKQEIYRRLAAPYENIKRVTHGEVFRSLDK